MSTTVLDHIDRRIVYALQHDARNASTTELAEDLGVTASTVGNRISQLERDGIITGYRATVDYERAGFPLHVVLACTAPVADQHQLSQAALDVEGVVNVRELVVESDNVQVEAVARSSADLARIGTELAELGLEPTGESLLRAQSFRALGSLFDDDERSQQLDT